MAVLRAIGVEKRFDAVQALRGVDLEVRSGERLAIIGPNGAGKTTLLSLLAGLDAPDAGSVDRGAGEIGWVPQQPAFYRRLTVAENLRLFARLERVDDVEAAVGSMLAQTGLGDRRDDRAGTLSGGNQQRLNIAIGLLAKPNVLLLDEPSAALDPRQRERLWEFISGLGGGGTTVVFSTHHLQEAEEHGERLMVLADGEAVFEGTPAQLRDEAGALSVGAPFEQAFVSFLRERGH